ncbi:unnamed protein product [Hymenolepis diminuta]|uniref:receptor protein serine/threonine kinase n=1 Tax=Hymenolepis diminuta TaxID=6216 RepID=A0A564YW62_HYMDI|nr:unnamed protein product [Hymenolepis diminuta]
MFYLLVLLPFIFPSSCIAQSESIQCLKFLCNPGDKGCQPCTNMSSEHLESWRRYIDVLLENLPSEDTIYEYYRRIREQPNCCNTSSEGYCTVNFINEPRYSPNRFYDMECLVQKSAKFLQPLACRSGTLRCCNSTFCNLPLQEEISKLVVETPKYNTLIVILPIFLVVAVLLLIGGWCFWRCRDRGASQVPVSMVSGSCLGDGPGSHGSPSDPRPWHMVECCGVGGPSGIPGVSPYQTSVAYDNGLTAPVTVNGVVTPVAAATTVNSNGAGIDASGNPSRTPVLMSHGGDGGASISSSINAVRSRGPGIISPGMYLTGASSIGVGGYGGGSGSTIVRGSEIIGASSYTTGASLLPASCSAPPGAGGALDMTSGSGSGAGQPLLVERTVARQVTLSTRIGEGRYGEVWLGRLHGDQVAVKIFSSRNENSWIREKEIYETATLRHSNILGFIAADNKDNGISTELWLIAEYHRFGSLYEFLQVHAFTLPALIKMVSSIANGLAHLHMAIVGTSGKPPIAHRDLKSRNILVKADGECCIGDLGFAVRYDSITGRVDIGHNTERVGTKRYMAPEVLDNTLCANSFDAYMQADIYSLGLVLWEMTRRVYVPDLYGPEDYQLPYQDNVGPDPLVEEMKSVVCEFGLRPHLPLIWQTDESLRLLYHIMTECWSADPTHRLSAMRIKKDLANQRQKLGLPSQPGDTALPPHILRQQPSCRDALPPGVFIYLSASSGILSDPTTATITGSTTTNTSTKTTLPVTAVVTHHQKTEGDEEVALLASCGPTLQPPNVVATAAVVSSGAGGGSGLGAGENC